MEVLALLKIVFADVDSAYASVASILTLLQPYKDRYLLQASRVRDTIAFSYERGAASLLDFLNAQAEYRGAVLRFGYSPRFEAGASVRGRRVGGFSFSHVNNKSIQLLCVEVLANLHSVGELHLERKHFVSDFFFVQDTAVKAGITVEISREADNAIVIVGSW